MPSNLSFLSDLFTIMIIISILSFLLFILVCISIISIDRHISKFVKFYIRKFSEVQDGTQSERD